MQKDFITVTPDSGNGNGTVTVAASQNPTTSQRSSFIEVGWRNYKAHKCQPRIGRDGYLYKGGFRNSRKTNTC